MSNWYHYLEAPVFQALASLAPDDLDERHKLPALMRDMQNLQLSVEAFDPHPSFEIHFDSAYEAHGALYVMEGGTQGGRFISRNIREKLPDLAENQFFSVYADASDERWQCFLRHLNTVADTPAKQAQVCQGAEKIYHSLINWFAAAEPAA